MSDKKLTVYKIVKQFTSSGRNYEYLLLFRSTFCGFKVWRYVPSHINNKCYEVKHCPIFKPESNYKYSLGTRGLEELKQWVNWHPYIEDTILKAKQDNEYIPMKPLILVAQPPAEVLPDKK